MNNTNDLLKIITHDLKIESDVYQSLKILMEHFFVLKEEDYQN